MQNTGTPASLAFATFTTDLSESVGLSKIALNPYTMAFSK